MLCMTYYMFVCVWRHVKAWDQNRDASINLTMLSIDRAQDERCLQSQGPSLLYKKAYYEGTMKLTSQMLG